MTVVLQGAGFLRDIEGPGSGATTAIDGCRQRGADDFRVLHRDAPRLWWAAAENSLHLSMQRESIVCRVGVD